MSANILMTIPVIRVERLFIDLAICRIQSTAMYLGTLFLSVHGFLDTAIYLHQYWKTRKKVLMNGQRKTSAATVEHD